jgi:GR25 family glycosyltransferase involved in LPS biosynthesis
MRIFVITLNRYDCRWAKYNKNYELFMGVDGYKIKEDNEYYKKIRNRYNIKHKQKQNIVGCFLSHLKVMEYIVENKLNEILIIEDDAVIDFKLLNKINLDELQQDKMTYFGGIIRGLTLKKDFNYERVVEDIFEGLNTIDTSKYKIGATHGYYIPKWEVAEQVITWNSQKYEILLN